MKKRILAIFLCVCMWATSVPLETFAGELGNVMDNVLSETEEQEQIIEEDNAELSALYRATNSSTVTEEQLYMLAPSYLRAEAYDNIIAKCGAMSLEAIDSVSETDAAIASYMYALKNGTGILWNNLWSNCGMSDSMYSEFEMNAAKELVCEYLKVNENLTKTCKKVEDELGVVDKVYDLTTTAGKESFREIIVKNNPLLTEDEANKMVSALFAETDTMIKYVGEGTELFVLTMAYVEMQMIEIQALDDLIVIHNQVKDTTMRDALAALRYEITRDIGTYIINTYFKDKVLKTLQGMVEDSVKNLAGSVFSVSALSWKLGSLVTGTVTSIYEKYKPSVSDIVYSSLLYQYWMDSNMAVSHYQCLFYTGQGTVEDIRYCETAMNFNAVCTKLLLEKSKELVRNSDKRLYSKMDCWESSMGTEVNYELYINYCLSNAAKAVKEGTLVITDTSASIKDENGNVIDETYDSTESIKAKFGVIQGQFKPNVGQTWTGDWGGAIQCFGFARMVFYNLFGCNMPSRYVSDAKYKYQSAENVNLVGQLAGSNVTASNAKSLLSRGKLGDIIQASGATYGQHTMVFVSADDSGVTVYDCNTKLNASEPSCAIHQWTINWNNWASYYGTSDSSSENGISLYRAVNYAQIYGDGDGMFYDDSVNFVIENGVLTKYNGWQTMVEIPDTVTEIGDNAFKGNTTMVSVNIPDGVTRIGNSAFYSCTSLLSVVIPDSVQEIGTSAFYNCSKITSVYLPVNEKFTVINTHTFYNCAALKGIEIPDSVTTIGSGAFLSCEQLENVKLSRNTEVIEDGAFAYNNKLTEIEIPKSLDRCGSSGPFRHCDNLKNIWFENGITEIPEGLAANCTGIENIEIPDTVTIVECDAFSNCSNLKSVQIPDSVTVVESRAFYKTGLEEIILPDSVTGVGMKSFSNCEQLANVKLSKNMEVIGSKAFAYDNRLTEIEIPKSLDVCGGSDGQGAFYNCDNLKNIRFENGITEIPGYLAVNCTGIESIEIPDTVTTIGKGAFESCINLKSVQIPDSVTQIESSAFKNCEQLENVKLSRNTAYIGDEAFAYDNMLTEIEIPKSLDRCGAYNTYGPFMNCDNLKKIRFESGITEIPEYLAENCTGIESIEIPDTVTIIEAEAFSNCTNLKSVQIPDSVTEVRRSAFAGCTSLTKVLLPDTSISIYNHVFSDCVSLTEVHLPTLCESISLNTFSNCKELTTINFPNTLKNIRDGAFYGCESLTEAVLPRGLEIIGNCAFYNCKALKKAVIPDTVTLLGNSAFYGCETLTDLTMGTGLTKINEETFYGCTPLTSIVIPYNVQSIGDSAFANCTNLTSIVIPYSTTSIASNAFSYPEKMTMYGVSGSYAESYAADKGIEFVVQEVRVTSIRFAESSYTMNAGETKQLAVTVSPDNATNKEVTYTSSDTAVATVSSTGVVKAKSAGTTTITATAKDGSGMSATCRIVVKGSTGQKNGVLQGSDGNWYYYVNGNVDYGYTGLAYDEKVGWWLIRNGMVAFDYTGLWNDTNYGWWLIGEGTIAFDYTGLWYDPNVGWWYVENGAINFSYNGLIPYGDAWWCVAGGQVIFDYTGLWYDPNVGWWYVENGTINFGYNGLIPFGDVWWCVAGGQVIFDYTGLWCDPNVGWWYVENGTINFGYNGLIPFGDAWWCVAGGAVIFDYTGLWYDPTVGWWYVENGTINFGYNGLIPFGDTWWCVAGGQIIFDYTGLWYDPTVGWWYVENGAINFGYTGLVQYNGSWFFVNGGMLDWGYTGPVDWNGATFHVVSGAVVF